MSPYKNRAEGNDHRREYYRGRVRRGLCRSCGKQERETATYCRSCQDKENARTLATKHSNKDKHNSRVREVTGIRRAEVLRHYGGKCSCCGEAEEAFLTIDHINGGGRKDARLKSPSGTRLTAAQFYNKIIKLGFPRDLQVLCFNCNCGRERNGGVCPHAKKKREWNEYPEVKP